jgi:CysZ protein
MDLFDGLLYNVRGLLFGIRTGKLLFWGLIRFVMVMLITVLLVGLALAFHQEILELIWAKPESQWLLWLWYLFSWLVFLCLVVLAALLSYLISQILFSVVIMDHMSRITELKVKGQIREPKRVPFWRLFFYLVRQEIPRTTLPVLLSVLIMILGWFAALGPMLVFLSSGIAIIFLAWDNTDLIPARRLVPFKIRFRSLVKTIPFHLGFGLPFLIPGLNFLFLSFAPVGATIYYLDTHDTREGQETESGTDSEALPKKLFTKEGKRKMSSKLNAQCSKRFFTSSFSTFPILFLGNPLRKTIFFGHFQLWRCSLQNF